MAEPKKSGSKKLEDFAAGLRSRVETEFGGKGAKALAKKEAKKRDAMRWKTGEKSETIELKKGGKVHRAGLARRRRS